jgi:type IV pilus assembly protein PilB
MTIHPDTELLSLEAAAEYLCVSKSTLYRLLDGGKLRGMKAGKQWRFRMADLVAYVERGPAAQALAAVAAPVLDSALATFADALTAAGTAADAYDDPDAEGEAGKIAQLVRRMAGLLAVLKGSDLHLDPVWAGDRAETRVVLRVDGALKEICRLPLALHEAAMLEWKRLAGLDGDDRLHVQEGRAQLTFGDMLVSQRVATVPTLYGEKLTACTIPTRVPTMVELGIAETPLGAWTGKSHGLLLICGPTGCGKKTTQAAFVRAIVELGGRNILSIEPVVQYVFPEGVTHFDLAQMSSVEALRAAMYHDPDLLVLDDFYGDAEMGRETVWAAETGHLVVTCQHANDPFAPLEELLEWGVKRSLLAANLIGVCFQRLAPRLCAACRTPAEVDPALRARLRTAAADGGYALADDAVFYQKTGCPKCGGRVALHEFVVFTPAVRAAFARSATMTEFIAAVRADGQRSFAASAIAAAVEGKIALEALTGLLPE